jgi:hypothetical protein
MFEALTSSGLSRAALKFLSFISREFEPTRKRHVAGGTASECPEQMSPE